MPYACRGAGAIGLALVGLLGHDNAVYEVGPELHLESGWQLDASNHVAIYGIDIDAVLSHDIQAPCLDCMET